MSQVPSLQARAAPAISWQRRELRISTQTDLCIACTIPANLPSDRIVGIFGEEIVDDDGYIDRKILGSKVFGKPEEMTKLTTAIGNIAEAVKGSRGRLE